MNNVLNVAVLLVAVAVAYYIGFKDGGRTFRNNLEATEQELNPGYNITLGNCSTELDFEAIANAVVANTRNVPVAQVHAERIGHGYERD